MLFMLSGFWGKINLCSYQPPEEGSHNFPSLCRATSNIWMSQHVNKVGHTSLFSGSNRTIVLPRMARKLLIDLDSA